LAHDLLSRSCRHGELTALAFTAGDEQWRRLSYGDLAARAMAIAALLRQHLRGSGQPRFVLLMLPNGPEYVACVYACLLANVVAVPFYPPSTLTGRAAAAYADRVRRIQRDCAPALAIAPASAAGFVRQTLLPTPATQVLAVEELPTTGGDDRIDARPGDLALLQYTSGSTREPKGVMVTHANLAHNVYAYAIACGSDETEAIATWLPLFHDMGLIGALLHPIAAGMSVHLTTPTAFARRPFLWLDMVTRSRATVIMGPNFAYDMCVRWIPEAQRESLDLSSLRIAVNGAEPVRPATIEAFTKAYQPYGLRPTVMAPGYGLAEATLCVTVSDWRRGATVIQASRARLRTDGMVVPPDNEPSMTLVSCGRDAADTETVIVDPDCGEECPPGVVGEIWVTGPGIASGYWNRGEISEQVFAAGPAHDGRPFLRTGDLGVKIDDELYIVGRVKDMIIQNGTNHAPQDIEYTAEQSHPALRAGGSAVFVVGEDNDDPRVVLVCEVDRYGADLDPAAALTAIRTAVTEVHGVELSTVALVRKGQVPKTTSGKVRRRDSAERWQAGQFAIIAIWPSHA
jgi:acyl-CoA synthetase (AMP-forming)/AMP-acid ligase II